jgi:hypothetical protein
MAGKAHGWTRLAVVTGAILTAGACLQREVAETWYLDPGGQVTWTVVERDVRSDAQAAFDRQNEEAAYWAAVEREDHPIARGLRLLDPLRLRTTSLRRDAPFTVMTEARFGSLEHLGRRLIERAGWSGTSVLTRVDGASEWTLTIRDPNTAGGSDHVDEDLAALIGDLDQLRVVLTSGRFEDATGFTLAPDRRVATVALADPGDGKEAPAIVLRLKWR